MKVDTADVEPTEIPSQIEKYIRIVKFETTSQKYK
jgi:hypothetical protein